MSERTNQTAVARVKSSLRRQRRILVISLIAVAVLVVGLILTTFLTRRTAFYDPKDNTKYYVAPHGGVYVLMTTDGTVLANTESEISNFVTAAGTIVHVDRTTGEHAVVATVLTEGSEAAEFNTAKDAYDVLLYPYLERKDVTSIQVKNKNDSFAIKRVEVDGELKFVLENRPDLVVGDTTMFATLLYCTGYTRTLMRLDPEAVATHGYSEYGLPTAGEEPDCYFEITDTAGKKHKVIIGDEIPSGTGYYAQYAGRDAVYILREMDATDYNSTFAKALFGRAEDYVEEIRISHQMTSNNYFDVSNFKIYQASDKTKPFIEFSYSGSIEKRENTFYATVPYIASGVLAGYTVNSYMIDTALYSLLELSPEFVAALGDADRTEDIDTWLKPYGLDTDSYAYRMSFLFNTSRTYNATTGEDVISKEADTEYHEILVSKKQEDGYVYLYNLCYLWDPETASYSKIADGYDMVIAVKPAALDFLNRELIAWVDLNIFSGHIAYISEISVGIPAGNATFPSGFFKTLYFDNSESFKNITTLPNNIPTTALTIRDSTGNAIVADQFRAFYQALLYSNLGGLSSLDEETQEAYRQGTGGEPILTLKIKYVLRVYDADAAAFVETGEIVTREYCFYRDYATPREIFVTLNGNGTFFMARTRVEKIISDLNRLYTGEEIKPQDAF